MYQPGLQCLCLTDLLNRASRTKLSKVIAGMEMPFHLKFIVTGIQGSHKTLLPPCTHQYAATATLAQLPSLLSPSHTCDHSGYMWQGYLPPMFLVRLVLIFKIHFIMDLQTYPLPPLKRIFAIH